MPAREAGNRRGAGTDAHREGKKKKKEKVNLSSSFLSWYSHLFLLDTRFKSHVYSKSPLGLRIADYRASHVSG